MAKTVPAKIEWIKRYGTLHVVQEVGQFPLFNKCTRWNLNKRGQYIGKYNETEQYYLAKEGLYTTDKCRYNTAWLYPLESHRDSIAALWETILFGA